MSKNEPGIYEVARRLLQTSESERFRSQLEETPKEHQGRQLELQ